MVNSKELSGIFDSINNTIVVKVKGFVATQGDGSIVLLIKHGRTVPLCYDNNSNLLTTTINGSLHETNQYNNANLPISKTSYVSSNNPEVNTYSYYLNGNLATRTKDADAQGTDLSYAYTYNNGGQFIQESITGNNVNLQNSYIYDNYGNIKKETIRDINESTARYSINTYNSANQLVSRTIKNFGETINYTYTYDDAGNMLTESKDGVVQKTYTYDSFDRLATYTAGDTTAQYTYNGDNLRQSKTVNNVTTQHLYNGANIVADICGDNTQLYIRGNSLHFNKTLGTSGKQTYMLTPKGDVSKLINADGTYEHFEYIPYGEISEGTLQANNPFGYCGEYTDAESGLIYLRNRYYNPELGMFITEDPIKDGLNWYAYCSGNPINFVDPWGLFKSSDNDDLKALVQPYTNQYEEAKKELDSLNAIIIAAANRGNVSYDLVAKNYSEKISILKNQMIEAERGADAVRITYYNLHNKSIPSDVVFKDVSVNAPDITCQLNTLMISFESDYRSYAQTVSQKEKLMTFISLVETGGKVDVKNSIFNYSSYYVYNNDMYRKDDIGNIYFGYAGCVFGYNEAFLKFGAGLYQIYSGTSNIKYIPSFGDDPRDSQMISLGVDIYNGWH